MNEKLVATMLLVGIVMVGVLMPTVAAIGDGQLGWKPWPRPGPFPTPTFPDLIHPHPMYPPPGYPYRLFLIDPPKPII